MATLFNCKYLLCVQHWAQVVSRKYWKPFYVCLECIVAKSFVDVNIFEKNFDFAMLTKLYP